MRKLIETITYRSRISVRIAFIITVITLASCEENNPTAPEPGDEYLVDATVVYSATSAQVQLLVQLSGVDVDINEFVNDIDIYKVTYNTSYKDNAIVASGLIALPKTTSQVPMISFQHGTITKDSDAPSNFSTDNLESLVYGALASSGFITVVPDYLGFGASVSVLHPYFVEDLTASAVTDLLMAARELAEDKNITFNRKLFLAGYSEGGYATMAAHKSIEQNDPEEFDLIASFPGAGAYDLLEMQQHILSSDTYDDPYYLAYLARAYQLTYDFNNLLTDFFQEPYASRIPGLFDHQKSSGEINSQLTVNIQELIQPELLEKIESDPAYSYLADAFEENTLTDWTPSKKMFMYHGTSDKTVPYENSVSTYDKLIDNGASDDILSLTPLPGDHGTAVAPYVADFLVKLWQLR